MHILICDKLERPAVAALKKRGHTVIERPEMTPADLKTAIAEAEVVVVRGATKLTADIVAAAPKLKLIVRAGVGLDNVDVVAAKNRGITVRNTPEATSVTVAELTIGLMLALARHICAANISTKSGKWEKKQFSGTELFQRTIGIVGFGRIGQEVAKRAKAFHMQVLIHDPGIDWEIVNALEVEKAELPELLKEADFITLHVPLNEKTRHMIGEAELRQMKKSAYLINCARGGVVDEAAVAAAVREGVIAGAGFDVYDEEPCPAGSPLVSTPGILCVPHIGGSTAEGQARAGMEVVRIIDRHT